MLAEAGAPAGLSVSPGEAAQSHGHKAEHVSVCADTVRAASAHSHGALLSEPGLHWLSCGDSVEMITEPGLLGLSMCVCVCGDLPGTGWGISYLCSKRVHLVPQHASLPWEGSDQTVCPAASMTGCREEGSLPACGSEHLGSLVSDDTPAPRDLRAAAGPLSCTRPGNATATEAPQ